MLCKHPRLQKRLQNRREGLAKGPGEATSSSWSWGEPPRPAPAATPLSCQGYGSTARDARPAGGKARPAAARGPAAPFGHGTPSLRPRSAALLRALRIELAEENKRNGGGKRTGGGEAALGPGSRPARAPGGSSGPGRAGPRRDTPHGEAYRDTTRHGAEGSSGKPPPRPSGPPPLPAVRRGAGRGRPSLTSGPSGHKAAL